MLLGVLLYGSSLGAEPLTVSPELPPTSLVDVVEILEDPTSTLRLDDVVQPRWSAEFRPNPAGHELDFGDTKSTYWLRFRLENPTAQELELVLEVDFPPLDVVELSLPRPDGGFRTLQAGDTHPFAEWPLAMRAATFPFHVPGEATESYYLRVRSSGSLSVPLRLSAVLPYLEHTQVHELWLGLYYGILLGTALYNLFLFFSLRNTLYLYLVFHITSLIWTTAALEGITFWFWPQATFWHQWSTNLSVVVLYAATLLFVRKFLSTAERSPKMDVALKVMLILMLLTVTASLPFGYRAVDVTKQSWILVISPALSVAVFWHAFRGYRPARIYAIAWGLLFLALAFTAAGSFGIVPFFLDGLILVKVTAAAEVLLAALAVAAVHGETRRALEASEAKFSSAFLQSPDAVILSTLHQGRLLDVNDGFERLTGWSRAEAIGRTGPDDLGLWLPGERQRMREILQGEGRVREMETSVVKKSGEVSPVLYSVEPVEIDGQPCLIGIARDLSEREREAARREQLILQLEAKNAELERFTYTVSHDLKTPLVTISGFAGLLERDVLAGDGERVRRDVSQIRSASRTMGRLLDELLELSRIGRVVHPSEEVALSELASEVASSMAAQLDGAGVELEVAPDLPRVWGDRLRLLEVFQNLIENALSFRGDASPPRIEIGRRQDGDEAVCYVRDNGVGIDPKYHERVFELFERLDPETEGTGIGLAIVKRIVEFHGGRVWVESEGLGRGTAFCFTLPRAAGPRAAGPRAASPSASPSEDPPR